MSETKHAVQCTLYLMSSSLYGAESEIESMLSARLGMGTLIDYKIGEVTEVKTDERS